MTQVEECVVEIPAAVEEEKDGVEEEEEAAWSRALRYSLRKGNIVPYKEFRRPMLSRVYAPVQQIISTDIKPGKHSEGCCVMVAAPDYCPCMAALPCVGEPQYIHDKREGSKYILVRENSIEWNSPTRVARQGACCAPHRCEMFGVSCVLYDIHDHINVVYFDDPMLSKVSNRTMPCHKTYEFCCGGEGEIVRMENTCLGGLCLRGTSPCCFVPCIFPLCLCPCVTSKNMYVQDTDDEWRGATQAIKILQQIRLTSIKRLPPLALGVRGEGAASQHAPSQLMMDRSGNVSMDELGVSTEQREAEVKMISHHLSKATEYADYNPHRNMFTRVYGPVQQIYGVDRDKMEVKIGITKELESTGSSIPPAEVEEPICACCYSPVYLPCCGVLPCCMEPIYVSEKRQASRYILIRENSIEWNEPKTITAPGPWYLCGTSCVTYDVADDIKVMYFDDPLLQRITNTTRCCNETRTVCCGGMGERVQIDSPLLCGLCIRGTLPCPFVPCCLTGVMPCALKHIIHVKRPDGNWGGASMAVDVLRKAWVDNVVRLMDEREQNHVLAGHLEKSMIRERRSSNAERAMAYSQAAADAPVSVEMVSAPSSRTKAL